MRGAGTEHVRIRAERSGDEDGIARVNNAAFGGTFESQLIDAVRQDGHLAISLLADLDGGVVGHIAFTPVAVHRGSADGALGLGPMAVLPERQGRGIGSRLVRAGLDECARSGARGVVVLGHPAFYRRFGFRPAREFGLRSEYDVPDDVFMALELEPRAFAGGGLVRYLPAFGSG